jgi:glycosyltransferase involved in cell wall biosynthesis
LLGVAPDAITVVVPGVDPAGFFHWTPTTTMLVKRLDLLAADGLLLLPARLTRRKNIGLALEILAAIRQESQQDFRLIVTGPPGPHNPANPGYLGELLEQRRALRLDAFAHFLYACGESDASPLIPDDATMANLYQLADALLFPSVQEGFGIPVLEAGLAGLPVFCADIPPFRSTGGEDVVYFDPVNETADAIAARMHETLAQYRPYRLRVRVRQSYLWQNVVRDQLVPLIESD